MRGKRAAWIAMGIGLMGLSAVHALERPAVLNEGLAAGNAHTITVRCSKGETIAEALRHPASSLIIRLQGVCHENAVIERDDVELVGDGPDAAVVGSVVVETAARVTLRGFTVRDTVGIESSGIGAFRGASVKLQDMVVQNAGGRGIQIFTATAQIQNVEVTGSGNVGLLVRGGQAEFEGEIVCNNNRLAGISVTLSSSAFSKAGQIRVSGNPIGLLVQENSSLEIPGGSIFANNNTRSGIELLTQGVLIFGTHVEANNNQLFGLRLDEVSSFSPFAGFGPTASFSNNGSIGVLLERASTVQFAGTTKIQGNGLFGLWVDESSFRVAGATITGNPVQDVRLRFGTKGSFVGAPSTIGSIGCESTVLLRGATCTPLP